MHAVKTADFDEITFVFGQDFLKHAASFVNSVGGVFTDLQVQQRMNS